MSGIGERLVERAKSDPLPLTEVSDDAMRIINDIRPGALMQDIILAGVALAIIAERRSRGAAA